MLDSINNLKNHLFTNIGLFGIGAFAGVLLIQLFFPKGTRTVSRRLFLDNFHHLLGGVIAIPGLIAGIDSKYLCEYRCPTCHKLLAKGRLSHKDDALEVRCRGCSTICLFKGEDADIIQKRAELLSEGLIPDAEKLKTISN